MSPQQLVRPTRVKTALILLAVSLAVSVLTQAWKLSDAAQSGQMAIPELASKACITLSVTLITALFIRMIGQGRNWVRVLFLILFLLSFVSFVSSLISSPMQAFSVNPAAGLVNIAQMLLQGAAVVFLFQRSSSEWFLAMKAKRARPQEAGDKAPEREGDGKIIGPVEQREADL